MFQNDDECYIRKVKKKQFETIYRSAICKILAILAMGFVSKELFILLVLKRIDLKKKALLMGLDGNQPIFTERDINQKDLPPSFRYYNFTLNYIQDYFPSKRKLYF